MPLIGPPKDYGGDYGIDFTRQEKPSEVGGRIDEFLSSSPWYCPACGTKNCEWNKKCIYCWVRHHQIMEKPK